MSADLQAIVGAGSGVVAAVIGAWAALRARRPSASKVELVDVSFASSDPSRGGATVVNLDVKLRNIGAQPTVLKRLVICVDQAAVYREEFFSPYYAVRIGSFMGVSGEYGVALPGAHDAVGARVTTDLAQVIASAEADRFLVTLSRTDRDRSTAVYLLRLEIWHDTNDKPITSAPIAVALPQLGISHTPESIRREVGQFVEGVRKVRQAIDQEMATSGRPAPDWYTDPPRSRAQLPSPLRAVDGDGGNWWDNPMSPSPPGTFWVNELFWDPLASIDSYLNNIEDDCRNLVDILNRAHLAVELLQFRRRQLQATLSQMPRLRRELITTLRL